MTWANIQNEFAAMDCKRALTLSHTWTYTGSRIESHPASIGQIIGLPLSNTGVEITGPSETSTSNPRQYGC
ncbi:hypothetical protein PPUJ20028_47190 [Pseudomonas putida]|uniref:Uncharacterized protein n=1 Tax=Pseudomonas putida TaxID=303 RepID=A0AA37RCQ5_PSEPU|nr:hypothetical protein PPUJ20028_47190 [Pseudomonas putida]GLO37808.1 hypothetical protein PPUN14671_46450 [Pseudomonas putida]